MSFRYKPTPKSSKHRLPSWQAQPDLKEWEMQVFMTLPAEGKDFRQVLKQYSSCVARPFHYPPEMVTAYISSVHLSSCSLSQKATLKALHSKTKRLMLKHPRLILCSTSDWLNSGWITDLCQCDKFVNFMQEYQCWRPIFSLLSMFVSYRRRPEFTVYITEQFSSICSLLWCLLLMVFGFSGSQPLYDEGQECTGSV